MTSKPASPAAGTRPRLRLLPAPGDETPPARSFDDACERFERFPVLGIDVHAFTLDDAVELLLDAPREDWRIRVHFAAVHTFVEASDCDECLQQSAIELAQ